MKNPIFTGVCTALVTPFLNNEINYPLVEQLLARQIDAGVRSVVLSGTTGESATLTDYEKIMLIQKAKEYVGSDFCVIAGSGSNSTTQAITLSIEAEKAGADALLVVAPYYNKGNADGLYKHYTAIANAVSIPIIIYNVPTRTGVDLSVQLYAKLCKHPNIVGVKEASSDIRKIGQIRIACKDNFTIWAGNDDQIVPSIAMGAKGVISVVSNIYPANTVAMAEAALDGDFDTASEIQCQLMPYIDLLFKEVNPVPVKYAMKYAGFDCGRCRLPLGELQNDTKEKIDALFI